jgi:hypothetical protein
VSDEGKGALEVSGVGQEDERCPSVENSKDDIETGVYIRLRDKSGGCPFIGQTVSGIEAT